jgi:hypothetical protein
MLLDGAFPPAHCLQLKSTLPHASVNLRLLLDAFEHGFAFAGYRYLSL